MVTALPPVPRPDPDPDPVLILMSIMVETLFLELATSGDRFLVDLLPELPTSPGRGLLAAPLAGALITSPTSPGGGLLAAPLAGALQDLCCFPWRGP